MPANDNEKPLIRLSLREFMEHGLDIDGDVLFIDGALRRFEIDPIARDYRGVFEMIEVRRKPVRPQLALVR